MNSNIKKTIYFMKRNGIRKTYAAVRERLDEKKNAPYVFQTVSEEELEQQRMKLKGHSLPLISIVVPAYQTPKGYLVALIESVMGQSYENWELILADASRDDSVEKVCKLYQDIRIKYFRLEENRGISENTNEGIRKASGSFVALLDHDDVLTKDALYEMVMASQNQEKSVALVYSDEDKCDGDESIYFDYHKKLDFNKDLLLTNNYICHFTMIKTEILQKLYLRKEYDGAQDFDLFLRVMECAQKDKMIFVHVPKVLYHWRSHELSTAQNPGSKLYAYEAGKKAITDYLKRNEIKGEVLETPHVGFYRVKYQDLARDRKDIAAIAIKKKKHGKLIGTVYDSTGTYLWDGMNSGYSGYMHRANLQQDVAGGDVTAMLLRKRYGVELSNILEKLIEQEKNQEGKDFLGKCLEEVSLLLEDEQKMSGVPTGFLDLRVLGRLYASKEKQKYETLIQRISRLLCDKIADNGDLILYEPNWRSTWKN